MSVNGFRINRRGLMLGAAALPLITRPALAAADRLGMATTTFNRFRLGGFEVTPLLAGTRTGTEPHRIFGFRSCRASG